MARRIDTTCCIVGGGPAGMMLGFLLARAGVDVTILEKHGDFLRDFRGDTIHPSTMELMSELGLLEDFLRLPHEKVPRLDAQIGSDRLTIADFTALPTRCKFLAFMPQWDFLDFLAERGRAYGGFHLMMRSEARGLIEDGSRVTGVRVATESGEVEIGAALVVGSDGRNSRMRQSGGFAVEDLGAPMDVLWFRISREAGDAPETFGHAEAGRMFLMLNRGGYWQCAFIIAKGSFDAFKAKGVDAFQAELLRLSPFLGARVREVGDWDDVRLLSVRVDRLPLWHRPGLLCIGDAAHAMPPIGGVGINLAIQDAVAAANALAGPLARGAVGDDDLAAVQKRRMFPTKVTQAIQLAIQKQVISRLLSAGGTLRAPLVLRVLSAVPLFRRLPAWLIGIGVRPEHVRTGTGGSGRQAFPIA